MQRIVIVGGGIGGLCAARAVALAGHEPVVLERSPAGSTIGAGLLLWPNAVHALDELQRGGAVRAVAAAAQRTTFRDAAGRVLSQVHLDAVERRAGAPVLVVERPALHDALSDGLDVRNDATIRTADAHGVILDSGERVDGDAVIGADGIGSVVRGYVCPQARPIDTGHTVIRGIADHDIGAGQAYEAWGRDELVGGVALPAARSYWFYEGRTAAIDGQDPIAALNAQRWPEPFAAQVAGTAPQDVLVNRILRLGPLRTWTRGTVALLGDAAHAMEPNIGQGAAQTIEDAEALLVALRAGDALPAALAAYATARRRRARLLQTQSSRMARLALTTHTCPRDLMMRLTPEIVRLRTMEILVRRHAPRPPSDRRRSS